MRHSKLGPTKNTGKNSIKEPYITCWGNVSQLASGKKQRLYHTRIRNL